MSRHGSPIVLNSKIKQELSDDGISICRVCLRGNGINLPLLEITKDMKTYFQSVLKQKILRKDPYQQVCIICSTLLEIIATFKDVARRANRLLVEGKGIRFDAEEEWHSLAKSFTTCKTVMFAHLDSIVASFEESIEPKQEEDTNTEYKRARSKRGRPKKASITPEPVIKVEPIKFEPGSISGSEKDEDDNDEDFKPPSENEDPATDSEPIEDEDDEDFDPKSKPKKPANKIEIAPKAPRKKRRLKEELKFQPQLCALCGKRICAASVESHMNQHRGVKPYSCPEPGCTLEFYGDYHLKRHIHRIHNKAGVKTNDCHICGKTIRGGKGVLNEHMRIHDLKEKKFVCSICGKGFTLNRYLRQHGMVHSEEFPHACSFCGKRFNNKWSMRTHEKIHQKGSVAVQAAEFSSDPVQTTDGYWTNDNAQLADLVTE